MSSPELDPALSSSEVFSIVIAVANRCQRNEAVVNRSGSGEIGGNEASPW